MTSKSIPSQLPSSLRTIGISSHCEVGELVFRCALEDDVFGGKPKQLRLHGLIGALRHGRVSRRHVEAVGHRGFDVPEIKQQRRCRVAQERRADHHDEYRGDRDAGKAGRPLLQRRLIGAARGIHPDACVDRLLDDLADERFRLGGDTAVAARLHRAEQRRLQRRLMLFEVERHLLVAHLPAQRPDHEPQRGGNEAGGKTNARNDDGGRW